MKAKKAPGYQDINKPFFQIKDIQGRQYLGFLLHDLDQGEAEAIMLAQEMQAEAFIIDERAGYKLARAQGLHVIGTLTVLLMAKKQGLIPLVKPMLDAMIERGRWYSQSVCNDFLQKINEI